MPKRAPSVLTLVVPGLLDRVAVWQADYGSVGHYPALEWLLARADVRQEQCTGVEAVLCALFGVHGPVPAGPLRRLALTGRRDPGRWMCMDPVHLEAGMKDLVLTDPGQLHLTTEEARALVGRLNAYLADDALQVEATTADRWHLCLPESMPAPETVSLSRVSGRPINAFLPAGGDTRYWHGRLNELQMLLFDAPENRAREARGLPTVNSVWPWGAGELPGSVHAPFSRIYGDDPLVAGLARCADLSSAPLPDTAEPVLAESGTRLVCLDMLSGDVARDDLEAWQAGMEGLEAAWFTPLRRALGSSALRHLRVYSTCGPVFDLVPGARWRLWRRARPLEAFAP
jgi:hypothetical protein